MKRLALFVVLVAACGKNQDPPPASTGVPNAGKESGPAGWLATAPKDTPPGPPPAGGQKAAAQQARDLYDTVCTMCHGATGKGDGGGAKMLAKPPRDYTDAAWQASITDDDIAKTIVGGGAAVGKSAQMPAQPQLAKQPEVLAALVAIIRGFSPVGDHEARKQ